MWKNTFDCDSFSHFFTQHLVNVDMSFIWSDKNVSYHSRCGALKSPQKLMAMRTKHMKQYSGIELRYCLSWWTFSHACMHLISKPITSIILYFILFLYWTYNIGCSMAWITCKILNAKFGKASIYYNAINAMTQHVKSNHLYILVNNLRLVRKDEKVL